MKRREEMKQVGVACKEWRGAGSRYEIITVTTLHPSIRLCHQGCRNGPLGKGYTKETGRQKMNKKK
jgi:hypothetical protein